MRRFLVRFLLVGFFLAVASFFLLALYYRNNFPVNTWINGVYCTGKSVEEVNQELSAGAEAPVIRILDEEGNTYLIDTAETGYTADYSEPLEDFIHRQNPLLWVQNMMLQKSHVLFPKFRLDEEKLRQMLNGLEPVRQEQSKETDVTIRFSDTEGWVLDNGLDHRLNVDLLYERVMESVADNSFEVKLEQ